MRTTSPESLEMILLNLRRATARIEAAKRSGSWVALKIARDRCDILLDRYLRARQG